MSPAQDELGCEPALLGLRALGIPEGVFGCETSEELEPRRDCDFGFGEGEFGCEFPRNSVTEMALIRSVGEFDFAGNGDADPALLSSALSPLGMLGLRRRSEPGKGGPALGGVNGVNGLGVVGLVSTTASPEQRPKQER